MIFGPEAYYLVIRYNILITLNIPFHFLIVLSAYHLFDPCSEESWGVVEKQYPCMTHSLTLHVLTTPILLRFLPSGFVHD